MGILPFFINVEMPTKSRQGEQIGVRVTVFNYMKNSIEALVLLEKSDSYKFVHVEEEGIVSIKYTFSDFPVRGVLFINLGKQFYKFMKN